MEDRTGITWRCFSLKRSKPHDAIGIGFAERDLRIAGSCAILGRQGRHVDSPRLPLPYRGGAARAAPPLPDAWFAGRRTRGCDARDHPVERVHARSELRWPTV